LTIGDLSLDAQLCLKIPERRDATLPHQVAEFQFDMLAASYDAQIPAHNL
jgi:hypothetical protein